METCMQTACTLCMHPYCWISHKSHMLKMVLQISKNVTKNLRLGHLRDIAWEPLRPQANDRRRFSMSSSKHTGTAQCHASSGQNVNSAPWSPWQTTNRIVHHALLASLRTREKRGDEHRKGHSPRLSCGKMWAACDSVGSIPHWFPKWLMRHGEAWSDRGQHLRGIG